jgi:hypothetical protein
MALDIAKGFKFPFNDQNWVVKLLIGTVLGIIPIVNFFSVGYAYKVFKKSLNNEEPALPEWDDWGGYFIQGLLVFVIELIYLVIPMVLLIIGVSSFSKAAINTAMGTSSAGLYAIGGLFAFVGGVLALVAALTLPMVLAVYAKNNEDFGSIFKIGEIIGKIFKVIGDYILVFVVGIGAAIILGVIMMIPILGWLIYVLALFYLMVVFTTLFGMACSKAFTAGPAPAKKA